MYKVGICGHFGHNKFLLNGQTIKTKIISEELKNIIGSNNVREIDTYGWKKNPIKLILNCISLIKTCDNIIILPAHNGVKIFIPMFIILNKLLKKRIHYVVIGAWLPELIEKNIKLSKYLNKLDGIYVETEYMYRKLKAKGYNNLRLLPNCKNLNILKVEELKYFDKKPYKLCTFSRVLKEKGIEDAIEVVEKINKICGEVIYLLDIYGPIDENYIERFDKIIKSKPDYISYKGNIDFAKSVDIIKEYFLLLFPTHFKTEGIPGTIIDAYSAGTPVIASEWNSASEIIEQNKSGIIYNFNDLEMLEHILMDIKDNPNEILNMKKNCLQKAEQYTPKIVIRNLVNYL